LNKIILWFYFFNLFCFSSNGRILSKTLEYLTLATTHPASGPATCDAFAAFS